MSSGTPHAGRSGAVRADVVAVAVHLAMASVMLVYLPPLHGLALPAGLALVLASMALAPLARHRATLRAHLGDLWAMAIVMIAPLGTAGDTGLGESMRMPGMGAAWSGSGLAIRIAAVTAWLLMRAIALRGGRRGAPRTRSALGALITLAELLVMLAM